MAPRNGTWSSKRFVILVCALWELVFYALIIRILGRDYNILKWWGVMTIFWDMKCFSTFGFGIIVFGRQ